MHDDNSHATLRASNDTDVKQLRHLTWIGLIFSKGLASLVNKINHKLVSITLRVESHIVIHVYSEHAERSLYTAGRVDIRPLA